MLKRYQTYNIDLSDTTDVSQIIDGMISLALEDKEGEIEDLKNENQELRDEIEELKRNAEI